MSEPDPVRWVDSADVPDGVAELVRSLEAPPPLPPAIRRVARPRVTRVARPPLRWIGPTVAAAAVVIAGLVLWRLLSPAEAPPTVALAPEVERIVDEAAAPPGAPNPEPTSSPAPAEANPDVAEVARDGVAEVVVERGRPPLRTPPDDLPEVRLERAPPGASGRTASLTVLTTPWSRLTLDGQETGRATPIIGLQIPAGTHHLVLVTEEGARIAVAVHAEPGESVRVVRRFTDPASASVGEGTLSISTIPWARVFVDGRDTGQSTPVRNLRVSAGRHAIDLRTSDGTMHRVEVEVAPGETTRVVRQLPGSSAPTPAASDGTGLLTINAMPWARVFVDGRDTGRNTPVRNLRVSPGRHTIGLRTDDGTMHTVEVTVRAGETERVVRQLDTGSARRRRSYDEDE